MALGAAADAAADAGVGAGADAGAGAAEGHTCPVWEQTEVEEGGLRLVERHRKGRDILLAVAVAGAGGGATGRRDYVGRGGDLLCEAI